MPRHYLIFVIDITNFRPALASVGFYAIIVLAKSATLLITYVPVSLKTTAVETISFIGMHEHECGINKIMRYNSGGQKLN